QRLPPPPLRRTAGDHPHGRALLPSGGTPANGWALPMPAGGLPTGAAPISGSHACWRPSLAGWLWVISPCSLIAGDYPC
ncbi:hypothetical protein BHM03_00062329, partial [Ensete ventricosum]